MGLVSILPYTSVEVAFYPLCLRIFIISMPSNLMGQIFGLFKLVLVIFGCEVHRGTKIHYSKKGQRIDEKDACNGANLSTLYHQNQDRYQGYTCHFNDQFLEELRSKQKKQNSCGTDFEVEIGTKMTALGRRRTFVVAKFDLGEGNMKVVTINIRSFKLHTTETSLSCYW